MTFQQLCGAIRRDYQSCPSYSAIWRAVMSAAVPATKIKNSWNFDTEAITAIAEKFNLQKIES